MEPVPKKWTTSHGGRLLAHGRIAPCLPQYPYPVRNDHRPQVSPDLGQATTLPDLLYVNQFLK